MNRPESSRYFRVLLAAALLALVSGCVADQALAQAVPYARTYQKSKEDVDNALKGLQAYAGQKLPVVDGFVAATDQSLSRYERAFYQFSIDLLPATSGTGTIVRVTAKITAWYADRDPSKSGYQVLPSNGRLELDLLDRLSEKFGDKPAVPVTRMDIPAPKAKLDLSTGLPGMPGSTAKGPDGLADSSGGPGSDEIKELREKRETAERRMKQLNTQLLELQQVAQNQAHPPNLVVVKKSGTPVLARPIEGSRLLFSATADDEFEFLEQDGDWIHVQISGASRGYIRRANLDLPEAIATRLKSPNNSAKDGNEEVFRIERTETSLFPGDWEALKGKQVKIYTVQPTSQDKNGTDAPTKLNFAASLFEKFSQDPLPDGQHLDGVVVIFDSVDGGIIGSTLSNVQQLGNGALSRENFWKQCYFDPPEAFQPASK